MNLHHPWLVGGDWNHGLFLMTFQKQLGWMDYSGLIDFNDVFDSVGIPTDFISIIFQRGRLKPPTSSHTVVKYTPVVKIVVNSDTDLQWIDHPFLRLDGLSCWLCHSWRGAIQLTHEGTWTKVGGQFTVCRGPAFVMPRFCNNAEITVGKSTKMRKCVADSNLVADPWSGSLGCRTSVRAHGKVTCHWLSNVAFGGACGKKSHGFPSSVQVHEGSKGSIFALIVSFIRVLV